VVKVETADGDALRGGGPKHGEFSLHYSLYNAGKESIVLDLKSEQGRNLVRRLIDKADVVVENFRPGVMKRLGIDYPTVSATNPKLVFCSISGFGQVGPESQRAAFAPVVHAYSGLDMMLSRLPDPNAQPLDNRVMMADVITGSNAFGAIQTALLHRELHGVGAHVDVSMLESMMAMVGPFFLQAELGEPYMAGHYPPLKTLDGYVNAPLISVSSFAQICGVIGRTDWQQDPRYTTREGLVEHRGELQAALAAWCAVRTSAECDAALVDVGVPCGIYKEPGDLLDDPQVAALKSFTELTGPQGSYKVLNLPFRISSAQVDVQHFTTGLGDNTAEVLRDILGLTEADLAERMVTAAV